MARRSYKPPALIQIRVELVSVGWSDGRKAVQRWKECVFGDKGLIVHYHS